MLRCLKPVLSTALVVITASALAAGDVGLIDRLSGEVGAKSAAGGIFKATAFMKVREGDTLTLPANSEAQIVYFESRRRELWRGPASLRAGTAKSEALSGMPAAVSEAKGAPSRDALAQTGNVQRLGSLTLRSARPYPDDATLERARTEYAAWTANAAPDDILPELSMIGLLRERQDPVLLAPYFDALKRKQPDRPEVKALIEQLGGK